MVAAKTRTRTNSRTPVSLDVLTRTKIRNYYLVQCLPYKEIAKRSGVTEGSVRGFIHRERLVDIKRENEERTKKAHDARIAQGLTEAAVAIAAQSEEHALGGLKRAGEAVELDDAKAFQSWTAGVRNLVQSAKVVTSGVADSAASASTINVNIFNVRGMQAAPAADQAASEAPAIDV